MAKKAAKDWKKQEEEAHWSPLQIGLLTAAISFIPFFFFILLPILTRNHLVDRMKIPMELLVHVPQEIALESKIEMPPMLRFSILDVHFQVPRTYTPTFLTANRAVFRKDARRISRTIAMGVLPKEPPLAFTRFGLMGWFMPTSMRRFLETALRATWHPVYLSCKAQLFAIEGISNQIFEARWDQHYRGFIFPTSGNTGYLGRVFRTNGEGYFEFLAHDQVEPIKLQPWIDLAYRIRPPLEVAMPLPDGPRAIPSLAETLALAKQDEKESLAVEVSLKEFFLSGKPMWVIPIALVAGKRGFFRETIEFYRRFAPELKFQKAELSMFEEVFDASLAKIVKLDIDPHLNQNLLTVYLENLSDAVIRHLRLKITLQEGGQTRSFHATILSTESLHGRVSKEVEISPPPGFLVRNASGISWRVEDLEITD
jgi:hypothetical protein